MSRQRSSSILSNMRGRATLLGALAILLTVLGLLGVLRNQAQAWPTKYSSCSAASCHGASSTWSTIHTAINGWQTTSIMIKAGSSFELDWRFTNLENPANLATGVELAVPTNWTVSSGTLNNPQGFPSWSSMWDQTDRVGWSADAKNGYSTATEFPNSPVGYTIDFTGSNWDAGVGGKHAAFDDGSRGIPGDLDWTTNTMGSDATITVPSGATTGTYTVVALGIGHDIVNTSTKEHIEKSITINVDATAPTVNTFTATTPTNSLTISISAFTASDSGTVQSGVTGYQITTNSTPPSAGGGGWSGTAQTTFAVGSAGTYTLYPWAKDGVGNVSAVFGSPRTVVVDQTAPTITAFTMPSTAGSLTVSVSSFTASDSGGSGLSRYLINESSSTPSLSDPNWVSSAPSSYTFSGSGTRTAYAWVKDGAGNISNSSNATVTITILADQSPPVSVTGPSSITYGNTGQITYTGGQGTGAISYSSSGSTGCSADSSTGVITVSNASGTCSVTVTKAGDATYNPSTSSPAYSVTLNKATQATLSVAGPSSVTYGSTGTLTSSGGTGTGAVTYDAGSSTGCNITGVTTLNVNNASGTCNITATKAADNNYNSASSSSYPVTLNKANQSTLSVTGPSSVTYGSTGTLTSSGGSGTGTLTYDAGSSTGCNITGGTTLNVSSVSGSCSVTATKAADNNYNQATSTGYGVTLNARAVTLSGTRAYDTTTSASYSILSITNKVGADDVSVASGSATLASANVGSQSISSMGTLALGGTAAGNYTLTGASGSVTITKANQTTAVTVSAPPSAYYGQTGLSASASGGDGTGAYVYDAGSSTACSVNSSSGALTITSGTGTCDITATRAADSNYNVSSPSSPASVTINKADQSTLSVTGPSSVTYGSTGTLTSSGGSGTGAVTYDAGSSTGCNITGGTTLNVSSVSGSCSVTATKAADTNYNSATSTGYGVTLNARAVTLSGTRAYDTTTSADYSILSITNKVGADDVSVASGSATLASANVGSQSISSMGTLALGGTTAGNYTLTGASGSVTITKANQATLSVAGPSSVTYGSTGTLTSSGGSGTGAVTYDAGSSTGCNITGGTTLNVSSVSGSCTVIATKAADTNYNEATSIGYGVTLNARAVTLSGTRDYDTTTSASYSILSITNKVGADDVSVASGSATLASANAGSQSITSMGTLALGGTAAGNYTLTGASGSVTINKIDQSTLSVAGPSSVTYGSTGTLTSSGGSGTGAVTYDTGSSTGCNITGGTTLNVSSVSGSCSVTATKAADTNYNSATSLGYGVTLNARAVTLSGTRAYDTTTSADYSILSITNKVGADDVSVASGSATLAGAAVGVQSITSMGTLALGGTAAGNYTLTGASGSVTITGSSDTTPPDLYVSTLPDSGLTKDRTLNVSGTVSDSGSGVSGVTVNGDSVTITNGTFSTAVSLGNGSNVITVTATDNSTNTSTDTRSITFPADPANAYVISFDQPDNSVTSSSSFTVSGAFDTSASLAHVYVNGVEVYTVTGGVGTFSGTVTLASGMNTILVQVYSSMGLKLTSAVRTVTLDTTNPSLAITDPGQDITSGWNNVAIHGTVSGTSPTVTMSVNGATPSSLTVSGVAFDTSVSLSTGYYELTFVATDSGNSTTVTRNIIYDTSTTLTTASPSGGVSNTMDITLTCSALGDYGCASTKYCKGSSGCSQWSDFTNYTVPVSMTGYNTLNFFSIDFADNIESVKTANYTFITGEVTSQGTVSCASNVCTVAPATGYYLDTLTDSVDGNVTGAMVGNQYTITNTSVNHTLTATYKQYPAKIFGTSNYYTTLQAALNAATDGQEVRLLQGTVTETINYNNPAVSVKVKGGYASGFATRGDTDTTTVTGSMTLTSGTLTADQMSIH